MHLSLVEALHGDQDFAEQSGGCDVIPAIASSLVVSDQLAQLALGRFVLGPHPVQARTEKARHPSGREQPKLGSHRVGTVGHLFGQGRLTDPDGSGDQTSEETRRNRSLAHGDRLVDKCAAPVQHLAHVAYLKQLFQRSYLRFEMARVVAQLL